MLAWYVVYLLVVEPPGLFALIDQFIYFRLEGHLHYF